MDTAEKYTDPNKIFAVRDTFPGTFENLPEDVQENLDYILFGLESVVRHLPDPDLNDKAPAFSASIGKSPRSVLR